MSRRRLRLCASFLPLIAWHGELICANLSGVVLEEETALSDVEMVLVNPDNGVILNRAYTDQTGRFSFTVDVGSYRIGAFKHEYTGTWLKDLSVKDSDINVLIQLEPKALSDDPSLDDCE